MRPALRRNRERRTLVHVDASIWSNSRWCWSRRNRCGPPARCLCGICATWRRTRRTRPAEKPITFDWPDAIHVDGALVGGGDSPGRRMLMNMSRRPGSSRRHDPDRRDERKKRGGPAPALGALEDEGFDDLGSGAWVESFGASPDGRD